MASTAVMIVQFGTATIFGEPSSASGFTSGIDSGTPGSMRNADELSMQVVPRAAASGMKDRETSAPAETSATSTPARAATESSLDFDIARTEANGEPRRARRSERDELVDGKAPLLQDAGHLPSDGAGGSHDGDLHGRSIVPGRCRRSRSDTAMGAKLSIRARSPTCASNALAESANSTRHATPVSFEDDRSRRDRMR